RLYELRTKLFRRTITQKTKLIHRKKRFSLGGFLVNVVLALFVAVLLSARHGNGAKPIQWSVRDGDSTTI
ncbi:hypothetical protein, partial [Muribaculum intestinale]|uniref:hypothetical protein n=1 Tax=Muribaculum intestinale TaxID=1796646 RepID=UPI002430631A